MSRSMQLATRILSLTLAAILFIAIASGNAAADTPPAPVASPASATLQPARQFDELSEVRVRGKSLSRTIEKTQDDFSRLYNKLNKSHDYDVQCGYIALDYIRLAIIHTCLPRFLSYNHYSIPGFGVVALVLCYPTGPRYFPYTDGNHDTTSNYYGSSEAYFYDNSSPPPSFNAGCTAAPQPPPDLLLKERLEAYRKNVLQVINSDERLRTMAEKLTGLYGEMDAAQTTYMKVRNAKESVRHERLEPRMSERTALGPHSM